MPKIQQELNIPPLVVSIISKFVNDRFPKNAMGAPRRLATQSIIEYSFLILRSGMTWRNLQFCLHGKKVTWHTIFYWFQKWSKAHIFRDAYHHLLALYTKRRILRKPILHFFTDTTFVKNLFGEDCLGPSPVDRGRKACKLSVICDDMGVVHSLTFHPANKNDCRLLRHTLNANKRVHLQGVVLCADKGYDTAQCRQWIEEKGMIDCIIRKKGGHDAAVSKNRTIVENVFGWLDRSRHLLVRYDKLISTYRSFTFLALLPILCRRFTGMNC